MRENNLDQAFQPTNQGETLTKRFFVIKKTIEQQAKRANILTKEEAKMMAVVSLFRSTQINQPGAAGNIGLLERALGLNTPIPTRARGEDMEIIGNFLGTSLQRRIIRILARINELSGFIDDGKRLKILKQLKELPHNDDTSATQQVREIESLLKIDTEEAPKGQEARPVTRSISLEEAFAPKDKVADLSSRKAAIEKRLKEIEKASDLLTEEARATMGAAVEYLQTINLEDQNAEGQIVLLEDALGVHPPV